MIFRAVYSQRRRSSGIVDGPDFRKGLLMLAARVRASFLIAFVGLLGVGAATAQSWEYRSYKPTHGVWDKNDFVVGTVTLQESEGKATLRISAGKLDACYRGILPANVTRTETTTTIEIVQPVPGCDQFRYIIRNDGSGGIKETKSGERWVKQFDPGLTPVK